MLKSLNVNLEQTINSGQVFLWGKKGGKWFGINGKDIQIINENTHEIFSFSKDSMDIFRNDDNLTEILENISHDKIVKKAVQRFPGLRLFRQDPFQCYISFIVSSNSNIQKIKLVLEKLCKKFGKKVEFEGMSFSLFPEPKIISKASISELLSCGLGYRSKFVLNAAKIVASGEIDLEKLKKSNYYDTKNTLLKIPGIGNKVADCIMLFSLEKLDAFPLDRWMIKILKKYYSNQFDLSFKTITEKKYESLHDEIVNYFGPYAGYSQQFLFKMERDLYQKKWL